MGDKRIMKRFGIFIFLALTILLGGCLGKVDRVVTNYYVLDYQTSTEIPELRLDVSSGKTL